MTYPDIHDNDAHACSNTCRSLRVILPIAIIVIVGTKDNTIVLSSNNRQQHRKYISLPQLHPSIDYMYI